MNKRRSSRGEASVERQKNERVKHEGKERVKFHPKETPGVICIERHIHDEAIVISGSLTIKCNADEISGWIEEEVGAAVNEVKERGGIIGQIKAAVTETSTSCITVADDKTIIREAPQKQARIVLATIMFLVDAKEAESIVRKALAGVRTRLRQKSAAEG